MTGDPTPPKEILYRPVAVLRDGRKIPLPIPETFEGYAPMLATARVLGVRHLDPVAGETWYPPSEIVDFQGERIPDEP
jgi:hypothetical protein